MIVGLVREELRVRVRVREMVCMLAQECSHSRKVEVCVFLQWSRSLIRCADARVCLCVCVCSVLSLWHLAVS